MLYFIAVNAIKWPAAVIYVRISKCCSAIHLWVLFTCKTFAVNIHSIIGYDEVYLTPLQKSMIKPDDLKEIWKTAVVIIMGKSFIRINILIIVIIENDIDISFQNKKDTKVIWNVYYKEKWYELLCHRSMECVWKVNNIRWTKSL